MSSATGDKIDTKRDGNGYSYRVRRDGRVIAEGWSAGSRREVTEAARQHVASIEAVRARLALLRVAEART